MVPALAGRGVGTGPTGSVAAKNYSRVLYARLTPEMWSRSAEGGIGFAPVAKIRNTMPIRDHPTAEPDRRMLPARVSGGPYYTQGYPPISGPGLLRIIPTPEAQHRMRPVLYAGFIRSNNIESHLRAVLVSFPTPIAYLGDR
jgi:hypothetical protein